MAIQSQNPATGLITKTFTPYTDKHVDEALNSSRYAFVEWKSIPLSERSKKLHAAAETLKKNRTKYAEIITEEVGKPITQSLSEIDKCASTCDFFALHAASFLSPEHVNTDYAKSYIRFDPLGVILAVMPWNFPFWQVFRFAAPALMAGNSAILKHASNVPQSTLAIEEVFTVSGFPKGLFQSLLIESKRVESIIADSRIAAVTLTGSENAGVSVAQSSGKHVKPVVLELGGSDPFIILNDADIPKAAKIAVQSRTINTGQSCIAAKRFIVEKSVSKEFIKHFTNAINALQLGDPLDKKTDIGPLAREDLRNTLDAQVTKSVQLGAKILTGGKILPGPGFYYAPTVLTDVKSGMPAYDEELFGPVASIFVVQDDAEAIQIANDTRYGLGANIWSQNIKKAERMAEQIEAGVVYINDFVKSDARLPFGGVKKSGFGRELGVFGIREFVNIKTVVVGK